MTRPRRLLSLMLALWLLAAPALADDDAPQSELTPLYVTTVYLTPYNALPLTMHEEPSEDSPQTGFAYRSEEVFVYEMLPDYALVGNDTGMGYVRRRWLSEEAEVLDPRHTPPYGVILNRYVVTLAEDAPVYAEPSTDAEVLRIKPGAGSKIAVVEFVEGFAKVLYWRQYGYIHAAALAEIVPIWPTLDPPSADIPIAAYSTFFEHESTFAAVVGKRNNIVRSAELTDCILERGDTFDYSQRVYPATKENGYMEAFSLRDGGEVMALGGGVCATSSTLYAMLLQLPGVTVLRRHEHGDFGVYYMPLHQDAAVSGSGRMNLVFRNDCEFPLRIETHTTGEGVLCVLAYRATDE